jgi:hypothetical protein
VKPLSLQCDDDEGGHPCTGDGEVVPKIAKRRLLRTQAEEERTHRHTLTDRERKR